MPAARKLSEQEIGLIWRALAAELSPPSAALALIQATGARPAEIQHLTLADISNLPSLILPVFKKRRPTHRSLRVHPTCCALLQEYVNLRFTPAYCEPAAYLFSYAPHTQPVSIRALQRCARRVAERLHIPPFTPYDLRRHFIAPIAMNLGLAAAAEAVGHVSVETTYHYAGLPAHADERVNELLDPAE